MPRTQPRRAAPPEAGSGMGVRGTAAATPAGIREDQVSNILLVRTQGVLCQSLGGRRSQTSPAPCGGMGAPAPQICEREIWFVGGLGRSTLPTGPRA